MGHENRYRQVTHRSSEYIIRQGKLNSLFIIVTAHMDYQNVSYFFHIQYSKHVAL